jgi:hypothetical protein
MLCVCLLWLGVAAQAQESRVEALLPADAILTVCYYGDNPDIGKTSLAQLVSEPEVQEWLGSVKQALTGASRLAASFLKVNPELLRPLLDCQIGLAVLPPAGPGGGPPVILAVVKVGDADAMARRSANGFLKQIGTLMGGGAGEALEIAGAQFTQLGGGPMGLLFGFRDDLLVLGTSQDAVARALSADTAKLAEHPTFQAAAGRPGSAVAVALYHHESVMERFGQMMPPEARPYCAPKALLCTLNSSTASTPMLIPFTLPGVEPL